MLEEQLERRGETLAALRPILQRTIADVQHRLTFRAQAYIKVRTQEKQGFQTLSGTPCKHCRKTIGSHIVLACLCALKSQPAFSDLRGQTPFLNFGAFLLSLVASRSYCTSGKATPRTCCMQEEVAGFQPRPEDLDYPAQLQRAQQGGRAAAQAEAEGSGEPAEEHQLLTGNADAAPANLQVPHFFRKACMLAFRSWAGERALSTGLIRVHAARKSWMKGRISGENLLARA